MAYVVSAARHLPAHRYAWEEVTPWIAGWLREHGVDPGRALRICGNAQIESRSSVLPIEEIFREKSLTESNRIYRENAVGLGARVSREAIARAGLRPEDIDLVISTSCTGFMIPSVDAYLIDDLGMRRDTKRLPITEMGCAAGATALARAREYLKGFPDQRVLVLSIELATLTFQHHNHSMDNIVSAAIFGDAAAAAVLAGSASNGAPWIADSQTVTLPRSSHLMGFDLGEKGFEIVLSKEIPSAVRAKLRPLVEDFLGRSGLDFKSVAHLLFHPGGKRILEVYREELGVPDEALHYSRKVLRECGNVSSATVLMILEEILLSDEPRRGDTGLMLAMGPGFSIEMLLFRWEG